MDRLVTASLWIKLVFPRAWEKLVIPRLYGHDNKKK